MITKEEAISQYVESYLGPYSTDEFKKRCGEIKRALPEGVRWLDIAKQGFKDAHALRQPII